MPSAMTGSLHELGDDWQPTPSNADLYRSQAYRTRRLMMYGGIIFAPCANRWHALLNMIKLNGRWTSESPSCSPLRRPSALARNDENHDQLLPICPTRFTTLRINTFIYVP